MKKQPQTTQIKTILVPIDQHDQSIMAGYLAMTFAKGLGSSLVLMYLELTEAANRKTLSVDSTGVAEASGADIASWMEMLRGRYSPKAFDDFAHAEERIRPATRSVADEICTAAVDADADLIVMTLRHHSTVEKMLQGGIVDRVLSQAPCPVTVVN